MARRSLREERSKPAYFIVDISTLPDEDRAEIIEDAFGGGKQFGLRVVEEYVNGPARQPVYGVYYGEDEARWEETKQEFGIQVEEATDEVRENAARQAASTAEAARAAEEAELDAIVNPVAPEEKPVNKAKTGK